MKPQIKIEAEFEIHKIDYCINASEYYDNTQPMPQPKVRWNYTTKKLPTIPLELIGNH